MSQLKDCVNCEFYLTGELGMRCGYNDEYGRDCWQEAMPASSECPGECLTGCSYYRRATREYPSECTLGDSEPDNDEIQEAQEEARANGSCLEYEDARPLDTVCADPGGDSLLRELVSNGE